MQVIDFLKNNKNRSLKKIYINKRRVIGRSLLQISHHVYWHSPDFQYGNQMKKSSQKAENKINYLLVTSMYIRKRVPAVKEKISMICNLVFQ